MRTIFISILLITMCFRGFAQYTIEYSYDNSGNRTARTIITLPSPSSKSDDKLPPLIDKLGESKIEIFPNPTKGVLFIRMSGDGEQKNHTISLFNSSGSLIFTDKIYDNGEHLIDLSNYLPSVYILVLQNSKEKKTYKIVKE